MSTVRQTRSQAASGHQPPSASPGRKEPKSTKKTNKPQSKETVVIDEDTDMGEGQTSPVTVGVTSTLSSTRGPGTNDLSQLIMQQQQQIALLTQLAQLRGSESSSSSSSRIQGPMPKGSFDRRYKGEGGATLDEWIAYATQMLAYYSGLASPQAASWLATGLEGAALVWYQNQFKQQPPSTSIELFTALRKRFQPIDSEETTRYELATLKQGAKQSVDEYATRFLHLTSLLPAESVASRIFQFRLGLLRPIDEKLRQNATIPSTLEEVIALAARIEGRSMPPSLEQVANMEMESTILARLAAMEQSITASQNRSEPRPQFRTRGEKGDKRPFWQQIPGMTKELADKRYAANQCTYCGSGEHRMRDCIDRVSKKPPRLN